MRTNFALQVNRGTTYAVHNRVRLVQPVVSQRALFSLGRGNQESQELHVGGDLRRVPLEFVFFDFVPAGFCGGP